MLSLTDRTSTHSPAALLLCNYFAAAFAKSAVSASLQVALRVLPTLGSTALLMLTMARCKHPLALPGACRAAALHGCS